MVIASLGANTMGSSAVGSDLEREGQLYFTLGHSGDAKEQLTA